jgi:hypothetical protein
VNETLFLFGFGGVGGEEGTKWANWGVTFKAGDINKGKSGLTKIRNNPQN